MKANRAGTFLTNPDLPQLESLPELIEAQVSSVSHGWHGSAEDQARATIQFNDSKAYRELLPTLDTLCARFGARLNLRFFGHYFETFDCHAFKSLPNVASLSIDSLERIENVEALFALRHLEKLRFAVYRFDMPDFLSNLGIGRLRSLTLAATHKCNFNLKPLANAEFLEDFFVQGHTSGIEALAELSALSSVSLSAYPKSRDLAFLNGLSGLRSVLLISGTRSSIVELTNSAIERLSIVRVRQLEELGPLGSGPINFN